MSTVERASLWRHRDFMVWWLGQSVSLFGSAFTQLALPITAAVYLHASAAQMGLLLAAQFAPPLLLSLPAGVWLDRRRRQPILVGSQVLSAVALGTVPIAALLGLLRIEHLYVVGALAGAAQALTSISQNAFLPALVGRDNLVEANSKLQYSRTLASLFGPGIAGFAIQVLTAPIAIAFDAASFVIGAVTTAAARAAEPHPVASVRHPVVEAREGLTWLWRQPMIRAITLTIVIANINLSGPVFVLYFVTRVGITPFELGIIFAAASLSSLVGARLAQPLVNRGYLGRLMVAGAVLLVVGQLLNIPAAFAGHAIAFAVLTAGAAISGFGLMLYNINQQAIRQALTPDRLLGRVQSGVFVIVALGQVVGSLLGGALGQTIGLVATLIVGQAFTVLSALPTILSPLRSLREVPTAPDDREMSVRDRR
jgi:MFS family permease